MKKLELNQMENLEGGSGSTFLCGLSIGFGASLGFALGGPVGMVYGGVFAASVGCAQNAY